MKIVEIEDEISRVCKAGYVICNFASLNCADTLSIKLKKEFHLRQVAYWCRRYVGRKNDGALGTALKHHTYSSGPSLYSLFTKRKHYDKSGYIYLHSALIDLKLQMLQNDENNLAIQKFAYRRNGDNWQEVIKAIEGVFQNTHIDVWVYKH